MFSIDEFYFNWMLGKLFESDEIRNTYLALCREMHNILFEFDLNNDENRQKDAQDLRYKFGMENGYSEAQICNTLDLQAPTLFEVIVALLDRVQDNILCDMDKRISNQEIFLDILKSLKLEDMVGTYNLRSDRLMEFLDVVNRLYTKQYAYNGEGGMFTVNNPKGDMRETELWYQFMWYLDEKLGGRYL